MFSYQFLMCYAIKKSLQICKWQKKKNRNGVFVAVLHQMFENPIHISVRHVKSSFLYTFFFIHRLTTLIQHPATIFFLTWNEFKKIKIATSRSFFHPKYTNGTLIE